MVTSKLSIFTRLTGVTKLFADNVNVAPRRIRSLTSIDPEIKPSETPPLQTPGTDVIPEILISFPSVDTPVIRLNLGIVSPGTV